jgi:hypothetical protein
MQGGDGHRWSVWEEFGELIIVAVGIESVTPTKNELGGLNGGGGRGGVEGGCGVHCY